ncbi:MAG: response regulator [Candidatus Latescibacteria bacterium]|nr:response regulator [bacterium]MBD3424323.1 response regulator [Candidatus Latescibacterota bacterium]
MSDKGMAAKKRVLFMDDEEMIQRVTAMMLEGMGYDVEVVSEGGTALSAYREAELHDRGFDVVILDLKVKDGMDGLQASQRILEEDPEAVIYISTGYSSDPIINDYKSYGLAGALAKPYTADELETMMNRATSIRD